MLRITFITGNQSKADFLAKYLNHPIEHQKIDLDEIQSLELDKIVEHKAGQAYSIMNSPVLVEDVSLRIKALGKLPGPFIKWFQSELGLGGICKLVDKLDSRQAQGTVPYCYFDGQGQKFFEGKVDGVIADKPKGANGFGWDPIFIPRGSNKTYAEMDDETVRHFAVRSVIFPKIKKFLTGLDSK